jgi:hypothetical protein
MRCASTLHVFPLFISQLNTHPEIWKQLQLLNVNDNNTLDMSTIMGLLGSIKLHEWCPEYHKMKKQLEP